MRLPENPRATVPTRCPLCREQPPLFLPHVDRLPGGLSQIEQPSFRWPVAQTLQHLGDDLSHDQAQRATVLLQRNLTRSNDWIILNVLERLGQDGRNGRQARR